jgi:NAD/NADP transhydrogenase alpha subunit
VSVTREDLSHASKAFEHATESLLAAATLDHLPRAIRAQVVEALVAAARVAGLLEALSEGFVTTAEAGAEHHG